MNRENLKLTKMIKKLLTIICMLICINFANSQILPEWEKSYNGTLGSGSDKGNAICIDGGGNTYITCSSDGYNGIDYLTIKYNSKGDTVWTTRYNGKANGDDIPNTIAVDDNGNVYVTGKSEGIGTGYDILTIKYNSSGDTVWTRRYNGSANQEDIGYNLAVDGKGNVYVVGSYQSSAGSNNNTGIVIKFNDLRKDEWVKSINVNRDNKAYLISINNSGNIIVSDYLRDNNDYEILEYDSTGKVICSYKYTSSNPVYPFYMGEPNSILIDKSSNIYVASTKYNTMITAKYIHLVSQPTWLRSSANTQYVTGIDSKIDGDNNIYVLGSRGKTNHEYLLIKYNSSGTEVWERSYKSSANSDNVPISLAMSNVSSNPDIYVTGNTTTSNGTHNITSIKYNSDGHIYEIINYDCGNNGEDLASSMVIDKYNNFYITGYSNCNGTNNDVKTLKYVNPFFSNTYWIDFYTKVDGNDDEDLSKEKYIAWGSNNYVESPAKICADGSKATIIRVTSTDKTKDLTNLEFRIAGGTDIIKNGEFNTSDYKSTFYQAEVKLTHPSMMDLNSSPYQRDTIQGYDKSNPNIILFSFPIRIYKAPVLMVHGLWGNTSTFLKMEMDLYNSKLFPSFGNYCSSTAISPLLLRANYQSTNDKSFATNSDVVPSEINELLLQTKANGYSAGKVDMVCHSMGGVLARLYLQNYNYRNDIHKLITLNTPHSGSQAANFLLNPIVPFKKEVNIFIKYYFGGNINNGAVRDLKVNSDEVLNNLVVGTPNLNKNKVPSHAIMTDSYSLFDRSCYILSLFLGIPSLSIFNFDNNDLIVDRASQMGGLAANSLIYQQCHMGSAANSDVIDKVEYLLNQNPNNSTYFDNTGFHPSKLTSIYKKDMIFSKSSKGDGSVDITTPLNGTSYNTGNIVSISIKGSDNITRIFCIVGNSNLDLFVKDTSLSSATFKYPIPKNAIGDIKILALGYDTSGFVAYDTVLIKVKTNATLDSLTFYPRKIYVRVGQQASVQVFGNYNDNVIRDLSYYDGVDYEIKNPNIAKGAGFNLIEGIKKDTTFVTVSYSGKSVQIPIKVIDADTLFAQGIKEVKNNSKNEHTLNFNIYPNPANDKITIENISINSIKDEVMTIYNIQGQLIIQKRMQQRKFDINITDFVQGVYIVTLSNSKDILIRKFVKE